MKDTYNIPANKKGLRENPTTNGSSISCRGNIKADMCSRVQLDLSRYSNVILLIPLVTPFFPHRSRARAQKVSETSLGIHSLVENSCHFSPDKAGKSYPRSGIYFRVAQYSVKFSSLLRANKLRFKILFFPGEDAPGFAYCTASFAAVQF